jgi:hypothetical protein
MSQTTMSIIRRRDVRQVSGVMGWSIAINADRGQLAVRTIPLGDINLLKEIRLDSRFGPVSRQRRESGVRRMYSAELEGHQSRRMTVAIYQGYGAEQVGPSTQNPLVSIFSKDPVAGMAATCRKIRIDSASFGHSLNVSMLINNLAGIPISCSSMDWCAPASSTQRYSTMVRPAI